MKTLEITDVPESVCAELQRRAALSGQTLSEYVLDELTRLLKRTSNAEVFARADERPGGVPAREIVAAVRASRPDD
jgi:hypothetical protein